VNVQCEYLGECRAFDTVRVCVGYSRLGRSSADMAFEIYSEDSTAALARGSITQVFTDKSTRLSTPIPAVFRAAIIADTPTLA
jgi:acyl-CoA thioester hydrolase